MSQISFNWLFKIVNKIHVMWISGWGKARGTFVLTFPAVELDWQPSSHPALSCCHWFPNLKRGKKLEQPPWFTQSGAEQRPIKISGTNLPVNTFACLLVKLCRLRALLWKNNKSLIQEMVENTFLKAKKIYSKLKIFIAGNVGELACPRVPRYKFHQKTSLSLVFWIWTKFWKSQFANLV